MIESTESKKEARSFLIAGTCIWAVFGLIGTVPAMFATSMFGGAGADRGLVNFAAYWSMISFPVACALSVVLAWYFHVEGSSTRAKRIILAPFIYVFAAAIVIAFQLIG